MNLRLFNSQSRLVEPFEPIDSSRVTMYSCGPTVYGYAHLGNLRAYVFVDTLRRTLMWNGFSVLHVMNITDVGHLVADADAGEDKVEAEARRVNKTALQIAEFYTEAFNRDIGRLNVLPASILCKATEHIQEMIAFATTIEKNGYAYCTAEGLYLDTSMVPDYGALARASHEGMRPGMRVALSPDKRNISDFVLWRAEDPDGAQRQMRWSSPWGMGSPGWHIECSCMSHKYLGPRFDIHTGGIDHRQIHHPNEIAQNQAFSNSSETGAKYWVHNNFLVTRDDKVSKSAGTALTLDNLIARRLHPLAYRYFVLGASYRSPLEFSWDAVAAAQAGLRRLVGRISRRADPTSPNVEQYLRELNSSRGGSVSHVRKVLGADLSAQALSYVERFSRAMDNDLSTPMALTILNDYIDDSASSAHEISRVIAMMDMALGLSLNTLSLDSFEESQSADAELAATVEQLLLARQTARATKDFAEADRIRSKLDGLGIEVVDTPSGPQWKLKRG